MNTRFAIAVLVLLLMQAAYRREPSTSLTVEFHHLRTADNFLDIRQVDQNNNLGGAIAKYVDELRLKAVARGGSGAIYIDSGESAPKVHVLLLAAEPVLDDAKLAIPRSGDVVYLLRNHQWEAYLQDVLRPAERKIRITEDLNKKGRVLSEDHTDGAGAERIQVRAIV